MQTKGSLGFQMQTIEVHFETDIKLNYIACNVLARLLEVKLPSGD
jgi:hypothetical protein